jgi:N-acetyl-gamma-glutamyl-phosphate reductase
MIKVGIIGGAGYTAGELLRILLYHPQVEIVFVQSSSNAGNLVSDVHVDLLGDTDLKFTGRFHLRKWMSFSFVWGTENRKSS